MTYPLPIIDADRNNNAGHVFLISTISTVKAIMAKLELSRSICRLDCQDTAADVQIALRKGDLDAILFEDAADHEIELASEYTRCRDEFARPDT